MGVEKNQLLLWGVRVTTGCSKIDLKSLSGLTEHKCLTRAQIFHRHQQKDACSFFRVCGTPCILDGRVCGTCAFWMGGCACMCVCVWSVFSWYRWKPKRKTSGFCKTFVLFRWKHASSLAQQSVTQRRTLVGSAPVHQLKFEFVGEDFSQENENRREHLWEESNLKNVSSKVRWTLCWPLPLLLCNTFQNLWEKTFPIKKAQNFEDRVFLFNLFRNFLKNS